MLNAVLQFHNTYIFLSLSLSLSLAITFTITCSVVSVSLLFFKYKVTYLLKLEKLFVFISSLMTLSRMIRTFNIMITRKKFDVLEIEETLNIQVVRCLISRGEVSSNLVKSTDETYC